MFARMNGRRAVGLLDLARQRPGVFRQDARPFFGRQKSIRNAARCRPHLAIPALEDQRRPHEANVARHLLRAEEQLREPLRASTAAASCSRDSDAAEELPQRGDHTADEKKREDEQQPLAGGPVRGGNRHLQLLGNQHTIFRRRCHSRKAQNRTNFPVMRRA